MKMTIKMFAESGNDGHDDEDYDDDWLQYAMIMIIKTNHNQLVGRLLLRVAEFGEEGGGVELPYGGGSSSLSPSSPLSMSSLSSSSSP